MKTLTYTSAVERQLARLPPPTRARIEAALHRFALTGEGDVLALSGRAGYRLRIGDFRVVFESSAECLDVLVIADRRDVYR